MREEEESHRLLYVAMTRAEEHLALSFSGPRLQNWAALVIDSLRLDLSAPRDEVLACTAPDGKRWSLRLLAAERPPEALPRPVLEEAPQEAALLDAPATGEQQDGNATVTALADFAGCPRRYFLRHYLGFDPRPRGLAAGGELSAERAGHAGPRAAGGRSCRPVRIPKRSGWPVCSARAPWDGARPGRRAWSASSISCWRWRTW